MSDLGWPGFLVTCDVDQTPHRLNHAGIEAHSATRICDNPRPSTAGAADHGEADGS